jgi:hypothetical protein
LQSTLLCFISNNNTLNDQSKQLFELFEINIITFKSGIVADGPHGSSIGSQCTLRLGRIKSKNEQTLEIRSAIGSRISAST